MQQWSWLIMKVENPITVKFQYFMDKCLPFGASISCAIFQEVSDALKFLIKYRTKSHDRVTIYLDDFLFVAFTQWHCSYLIQQFLDLCEEVGVPISEEKTEWVSESVVFLGILLNGKFMILSIPEDKRQKAISLLRNLVGRSKATVKELQTLCGYLNFLTEQFTQEEFLFAECTQSMKRLLNQTGIRMISSNTNNSTMCA